MILAVCAAVVCCGGTVTFVWQQYEGPSRSKDRIALVRTTGASSTLLVAIDGESILAPLDYDNRLHVEVLPGIHDIDVAAPSIGLRHVISVRLLAEAGKVYRVEVSAPPRSLPQPDNGEPQLWDGEWQAHAYEVDRDTDARRGIADAPAAPASFPRDLQKDGGGALGRFDSGRALGRAGRSLARGGVPRTIADIHSSSISVR